MERGKWQRKRTKWQEKGPSTTAIAWLSSFSWILLYPLVQISCNFHLSSSSSPQMWILLPPPMAGFPTFWERGKSPPWKRLWISSPIPVSGPVWWTIQHSHSSNCRPTSPWLFRTIGSWKRVKWIVRIWGDCESYPIRFRWKLRGCLPIPRNWLIGSRYSFE